jgi:hypothetical protein
VAFGTRTSDYEKLICIFHLTKVIFYDLKSSLITILRRMNHLIGFAGEITNTLFLLPSEEEQLLCLIRFNSLPYMFLMININYCSKKTFPTVMRF